MYTVTLFATPPLQWSEPDITAIGSEHSAVNGEVPNMTVTIDNARGQHTARVAAANVLRLRAQLDRDGQIVFAGAVQAVGVGPELTLELEA